MLFKWHRLSWFVCAACAALLWHSGSAKAQPVVDGPNVRVTDAGLNGGIVDNVRLAEQDGVIYAVWEDDRGNFDRSSVNGIYFAKSTDGGATWGPNLRVNEDPYDDWPSRPDIAVQPDGAIWVVYHLAYDNDVNPKNDLRLARSTDGGASFTVTNLVNGEDRANDLWLARIAADAGTGDIYVMSQRNGGGETVEGTDLFLLRYSAAMESWEPEPTIINDRASAGRMSGAFSSDGAWFSLTTRDGVICAAWEDRGRSTTERHPIYGACSSDGGASFGANFKISEDDGIQPALRLGPEGELYAAYAIDSDASRNVKLRLSTNLGATWQPTRPVTAVRSYRLRDWELDVTDDGQVVLVYVHEMASRGDLYFAASLDQGVTFTQARLEDEQGRYPDSAEQYAPALAVGGSGQGTWAYVAWMDDRNIEDEIWSARVILGGEPAENARLYLPMLAR